jgi:tetratricopeptide (TPR) repeat protein
MTKALALGCTTVAVAMLGCAREPPARPAGPVESALLSVAAELGATAAETKAASAGLHAIASAVERHHRRSHGDIIDDINAVVWDELSFVREVDSAATRFFQLAEVVARRRGNCLGLGALYLALGERLGVPLDGILLPGHFLVRTREPSRRNIELLRRGEAMPEPWYRGKYGPWPGPDSAYDRPLTLAELVAIHWYNRGNDLRESDDLAGAEAAFVRAARGFPGFAEAHANLGAVLQSRGANEQAAAAYHEAARAWPDLPGLAGNVEQLGQRR